MQSQPTGHSASGHYDHRSVAGFRDVTGRTPTLGIWDDHDFGPNNSDRTAEGRMESLATFQSMWANPSYGEPGHPGIYHHFQHGDIAFFMLDDRFYRSPNRSEDRGDKTMLGERQWAWLKAGLKQSTAKLKFIASGSEWQKHGHVDSWTSFRREQRAFFEWIDQEGIEGVILLSGDRHFTGGYQINQRVMEITSGPLGSNNYPTPNLPEMFLNHGVGKLYCVFDVDTRSEVPQVILEVHRAGEGLIDRRDFTMDEINGKARLATLPVRKVSQQPPYESDCLWCTGKISKRVPRHGFPPTATPGVPWTRMAPRSTACIDRVFIDPGTEARSTSVGSRVWWWEILI